MTRPLVSYVVVTRERVAEALVCLESIARQEHRPREIVVVVNGSNDASAATIRARVPEARVVEMQENAGVGGGRNRGLAVATGEIAVLLDDDAVLPDPAATARVVARFAAEAELACLCFSVHEACSGRIERRAIPRADKRLPSADEECAYFCGTGFAVRVAAMRDAGPFWEPLFYVGEELDLSYRLLELGRRIRYATDVAVVHALAPAGRSSGQWCYFSARNRPWVAMRHLPWAAVVTTTLAWWAWALVVGVRRGEMGAAVRGVRDSLRGARAALAGRRVVSRATRARVRGMSGRYWY